MYLKRNKITFILIVLCSLNSLAQLLFEGKIEGEIFYRNAPNNITKINSYYKGDKSRFEIELKDSVSSSSFKPNFIIINDFVKGERFIISEKSNKTILVLDLPAFDNNSQQTEKTSDYVMFAKYDCQKTILTYTLTKDNSQGQSIIYVNNNFSVNKPNGKTEDSKYYKLPLSIESSSKEKGNHTYRATNINENNLNDNLFSSLTIEGYTLLDAKAKQRASETENIKVEDASTDKYSKYTINELQDLKKAAAVKEDFDTAAEIKDIIDKRKLMESKDGKYSKLYLSQLHQLLNMSISNYDFVFASELSEEIIKRSK